MSSYLIKQFIKGIALRGETANITENVEGSLFHNSTDQKIKSYIEGAVREVITESQIQTLTNKTISAADNLIVVDSTNPNLASIELNAALTELQNDIDSNSGNLSSHIAALDPHPQYETSVEAQSKVDAHANRVDNPHSVTKTQIGLSNADNTSDLNKPISTATQAALNLKYDASNPSGYVNATEATAAAPVQSVAGKVGAVNLTKSDVGLADVDNTSDLNKPISTATQTALNLKLNASQVGVPNGAASLDGAGKVPAAQLPSYVDDVIEAASFADLPTVGETGKAYVTLDNNKVYRWTGSVYVEISPSIGTTWGSITGTLAVQTDLQSALDGKANSTHTHSSSDITNFNESVDDRVNSLIVAGTNISANYDDLANTLTISSTVSVITDHTALSSIGTNSHADIDSHISSTSNPHSVTKSQVGLSNVPNVDATSRANHTGTQTASTISDFNFAADARVSAGISAHESALDPHSQYETSTEVQSKVDAHANLTNNPHAVTKSQVGLGNVDNTSDLNKPISSATQLALDGKANTSHSHVATDITDLSEAIDDRISSTIVAGTNVTVSYDDLANTLTISATGGGSGGATTLDGLTDVSAPSPSNGQALIYNTSTSQWEAQTISSGSGATDLNGLNDVTLSGTLDNQILRYDLASTQWKNETLLKDDIGLSNVDNTSDVNKPISTATQTALNAKANSVHTHVSTDVTDFSEAVDGRVSSLLVAGSNITLAYDDLANTLSISAVGAPASTSAERLITNVFNASGSPIPKMSAIYISGIQGDQPKVVLAQANSEMSSSKTYGLVQTDIPNMSAGVIIEQGRLENLDTDVVGWVEGDPLWLSPTVAGGITNVKPSAPNHAVFIGYLIRKHQNVGVIQVSIQNGYELNELHNVSINGIANAQVIQYESATSLWKNHTLVKADVGLSNVDNTADLDKPVSTATQTALNGKANSVHTHVAADITDFNSAVDARIPSIPSNLNDLNDVDVSFVAIENQASILYYEDTLTQWRSTRPDFFSVLKRQVLIDEQVGSTNIASALLLHITYLNVDSGSYITLAKGGAGVPASTEQFTFSALPNSLYNVQIGITPEETMQNLVAKINDISLMYSAKYISNGMGHFAGDAAIVLYEKPQLIPGPKRIFGEFGNSNAAVQVKGLEFKYQYYAGNSSGSSSTSLPTSDTMSEMFGFGTSVNDFFVPSGSIYTVVESKTFKYWDSINQTWLSSPIQAPTQLSQLQDVSLLDPILPNQVLTYDGITSSWKNQTPSGGSGSAKYVRGFTFSGIIPIGTTGIPVIITSAATVNKIKAYGLGISGVWTFDLYKNGAPSPFQSISISTSSVVSLTSSEGVLENDVITCVVSTTAMTGTDFSITLELS
jgi:hypothetical protein